MRVKDILDKTLSEDFQIINHYTGMEYPYNAETERRKVRRIIIKDNWLILTV